MANINMNFDPNAHKPAGEGVSTLTHEGWMPLKIVSSEVKANSSKTGHLLEFSIVITDGPDAGSYVAERLNIDNPSEKAVQIAYSTLAAYAKAVGQTQAFTDSAVLHDRPFLGFIKHDDPNDGYEPKPEVKKWKAIGSDVPAPTPYVKPETTQPSTGGQSGGWGQQAQQTQQPAQQQSGGWGNGQQQQQQPEQNQQTQQQQGWNPQQGGKQPWSQGGAQQQQQTQQQTEQPGNTQPAESVQQPTQEQFNQNSGQAQNNGPAWGNGQQQDPANQQAQQGQPSWVPQS